MTVNQRQRKFTNYCGLKFLSMRPILVLENNIHIKLNSTLRIFFVLIEACLISLALRETKVVTKLKEFCHNRESTIDCDGFSKLVPDFGQGLVFVNFRCIA